MIKTVIFDMNGVIIDDESVHKLAFNKVLEAYGTQVTPKEYARFCSGRTDREGFELIADFKNIDLDIDRAIEAKDQVYSELFKTHKKAVPGVLGLIKALYGKYQLACCSGSVRHETDMILKDFGVFDCFQAVISADDVNKGKPDPEPYIITLEKLGANPAESIAIEDTPAGIKSAHAAGMKCIGITTTHSKEELAGADFITEDFYKIIDFLENRG